MLREGLRGLGEGLKDLGDQRSARKSADKILEAGGPDAEMLAEDVRRRKITGSEALRIQDEKFNQTPLQLYGKMLSQYMLDPNMPDDKRVKLGENMAKVAKIIEGMKSAGEATKKIPSLQDMTVASLIEIGATAEDFIWFHNMSQKAKGDLDVEGLTGMETALTKRINEIKERGKGGGGSIPTPDKNQSTMDDAETLDSIFE